MDGLRALWRMWRIGGVGREAMAHFIAGRMDHDDWCIWYRFTCEEGRTFDAEVRTGYDAVHAAYDGDRSFMDRVVTHGGIRVRYHPGRPALHVVWLAGESRPRPGRRVRQERYAGRSSR